MGVMYYILSPFSWLLNFFYSFTDSYGISLILFALVIKIILFNLLLKITLFIINLIINAPLARK